MPTTEQQFTNWELTVDGKSVPFTDMVIPVSFISKCVPGVEICGKVLKLPPSFNMTDIKAQYKEWCIEQGTKRMEIMNSAEEELSIPAESDTTNIIIQYHLFLKEQEEKHNKWLGECKEQKLKRAKSPKETNTVESILEEREKTHGKFCDHAYYTQSLKYLMHESPNWGYLDCSKKESLEMIAHKIGRILAGDPNLPDHWDDIAGYATLISQELAEQKKVKER